MELLTDAFDVYSVLTSPDATALRGLFVSSLGTRNVWFVAETVCSPLLGPEQLLSSGTLITVCFIVSCVSLNLWKRCVKTFGKREPFRLSNPLVYIISKHGKLV